MGRSIVAPADGNKPGGGVLHWRASDPKPSEEPPLDPTPPPPTDSPTLEPGSPVPVVEGAVLARGETPDRATLDAVRARDPAALARFFDAYFGRVYAVALRLLGDRTRAEDATSDVFLRVHRAADRLDPARDPWPWLVTITTNVCRDFWRSGHERMRRHSSSPDEPGVEAALGASPDDPVRDLAARERERAVHDALAALPPDLRLSVVLYDYVGRSHEEIAGLVGISHEAARKRHSRALTALGRALKERWGS